jgi:phosphatidylglycerophosphate synthase
MTPDEVTVIGAVLACLVSFQLLSQGSFLIGGILLSLFGFSDLLDGTMARLSNSDSPWGAFLDSTLDRIVDGAIYGSLIFWYAHDGKANRYLLISLIIGLVAAQVTSYTRARWESVGVIGKVGLAERSERMIALCTGLIVTGIGLNVMPIVIHGLAFASSITVVQRIWFVRKQLKK